MLLEQKEAIERVWPRSRFTGTITLSPEGMTVGKDHRLMYFEMHRTGSGSWDMRETLAWLCPRPGWLGVDAELSHRSSQTVWIREGPDQPVPAGWLRA